MKTEIESINNSLMGLANDIEKLKSFCEKKDGYHSIECEINERIVDMKLRIDKLKVNL